MEGAREGGHGWALRAPVLLSVAFQLAFIVRSACVIGRELTFPLFDDAMISMRYARSAAAGYGLVWNPGQPPVEGYTNLLWTLWMALLHRLHVPQVGLAVALTGVLVLVALVATVRALAEELAPDEPAAAIAAVWLTALCYPLIFWTLRGMEVGLVALLITRAALAAIRGEERALAVCVVLAVLTRTDAAAPCAVAIGGVALLRNGPGGRVSWATALRLGAVLALTLGAHTAFRVAHYGRWLPNTYDLKLGGVSLLERAQRGGAGLIDALLIDLLGPLALAVVAAVLRRPRLRSPEALLAALALTQGAYSVYVGGDAWDHLRFANRYLAAGLPALFVLAGLGVSALVRADAAVRRRVVLRLAGVFGLAAVALGALWWPEEALQLEYFDGSRWALVFGPVAMATGVLLLLRPSAPSPLAMLTALLLVGADAGPIARWGRRGAEYADDDAMMARYGRLIRTATDPRAVIAVYLAGNLPYYAERPAVDLLGKNDPVIARAPPARSRFYPGHNKWDYAHSLAALRPDLIAQLYFPDDALIAQVRAWGYDRIAETVFVRSDSSRVDPAVLQAGLAPSAR